METAPSTSRRKKKSKRVSSSVQVVPEFCGKLEDIDEDIGSSIYEQTNSSRTSLEKKVCFAGVESSSPTAVASAADADSTVDKAKAPQELDEPGATIEDANNESKVNIYRNGDSESSSSDDGRRGRNLPECVQKTVQKALVKEMQKMYIAAYEALPTETDIEEYEKELETIKEKKQEKKERKFKKKNIYKYGRYMMIALALFSLPTDGWKCYKGVETSERALEAPSAMEVFDFYSSTIATHVVGLAAAIEHNLAMTIVCRAVSTYLYQKDYSSKPNNTMPTDPKKIQKYIRDKIKSGEIPKHRLPKGYTFPKDDEEEGKNREDMMDGMDDDPSLPPELRRQMRGRRSFGKKKLKPGKATKSKASAKKGDSGKGTRSKSRSKVPSKLSENKKGKRASKLDEMKEKFLDPEKKKSRRAKKSIGKKKKKPDDD